MQWYARQAAHNRVPLVEYLERWGAELPLWLAFSEAEPYGDERGDLQAAKVASVFASFTCGKEIPQNAFLPELPTVKAAKKQTRKEAAAEIKRFVRSRSKKRRGK